VVGGGWGLSRLFCLGSYGTVFLNAHICKVRMLLTLRLGFTLFSGPSSSGQGRAAGDGPGQAESVFLFVLVR